MYKEFSLFHMKFLLNTGTQMTNISTFSKPNMYSGQMYPSIHCSASSLKSHNDGHIMAKQTCCVISEKMKTLPVPHKTLCNKILFGFPRSVSQKKNHPMW